MNEVLARSNNLLALTDDIGIFESQSWVYQVEIVGTTPPRELSLKLKTRIFSSDLTVADIEFDLSAGESCFERPPSSFLAIASSKN